MTKTHRSGDLSMERKKKDRSKGGNSDIGRNVGFFVGMALTLLSTIFAALGFFRLIGVRPAMSIWILDKLHEEIPNSGSVCCGLTILFIVLMMVGIFLAIYSVRK